MKKNNKPILTGMRQKSQRAKIMRMSNVQNGSG